MNITGHGALQTPYDPPPGTGLDLVYLDESLLLVNKPAGLLSVPGRGADKADSMATRVQSEFPDASCVHRLDMGTSGLLMFARDLNMHRQISAMFRERKIVKRYVALLAGHLKPAAGAVELPLLADWPNRPRQKLDFVLGRPALTRYSLLEYAEFPITCPGLQPGLPATRVQLEPVSGRTHQLRVHMAAIGHPIIGDVLYAMEANCKSQRLLLHACMLSFAHPLSGKPLTVECEPPF